MKGIRRWVLVWGLPLVVAGLACGKGGDGLAQSVETTCKALVKYSTDDAEEAMPACKERMTEMLKNCDKHREMADCYSKAINRWQLHDCGDICNLN